MQSAVVRFQSEDDCKVLLVTVGVGAQGLTLTRATTVYLMEPCVNVADEAQAMNRVHRIGQAHQARCIVLYAEGTLEERLLHQRVRSRVGQLTSADSADATADGDQSDMLAVAAQPPASATASAGDDLPLHNLNELIGFV